MLFVSALCSAQLQVTHVSNTEETIIGKIAPMGVFQAELSYHITEQKDTAFTLLFRNNEYTQIIDTKIVHFGGGMADISSLYEIMMSVFEDGKKEDYAVSIMLGDKSVRISKYKSLGMTCCWVSMDNGYHIFTKQNIKKLFDK